MSTEPLVCCVMLTRDRPEMAARAVRSFRAQTYDPALLRLRIYDTGRAPLYEQNRLVISDRPGVVYEHHPGGESSIGRLRNEAIAGASLADIIVHFDDDDWSHPERIAEQVALLQASGADAAGYRDMFFWRTRGGFTAADIKIPLDESVWLYINPRRENIVGTSLCYWRRTWERKPFRDIPHKQVTGREDSLFVQGLRVATESCCIEGEPRMIASIHGGNLTPYNPEAAPFNYRRVPEWDAYCREKMKL